MITENVLRSADFWRAYLYPDGVGIEPIEGWPFIARKFSFDLPCSHEFLLRVKYDVECEITLLLVQIADGLIEQMAWIDQVRAHPYALRWEELMQLDRHWRSSSIDLSIVAERVLLLAPFVGISGEERVHLPVRRRFLADALAVLLPGTQDAVALSECALRGPPEEDYEWKNDARLGWLFSGAYSCYSLRNGEHSDGMEGRFPFMKLEALCQQLHRE